MTATLKVQMKAEIFFAEDQMRTNLKYIAYQYYKPFPDVSPYTEQIIQLGSPQDLGASPKKFVTPEDGFEYYKASLCADLITAVNVDLGFTYYTGYEASIANPDVAQIKEIAQDAVGDMITTEFNYNDSVNTLGLRAKSFGTVSLTLNTAAIISSTRDVDVDYRLPITAGALVLTGSRGQALLQYADNSGMSVNVVNVDLDDFGIAAGLIISVNGILKVRGTIPAGKYVKVSNSNIAGTPTWGSLSGREVLQ